MHKLHLAAIICFLFSTVSAQDLDYSDSLPINQIKVLGSHNSYRRMTDSGILKFIHLADPFFKKELPPAYHLEYDHLPLDSQLENYGMRSFELDIYYDPKGGRYYKRQGNALRFRSTKSNVDALLWPGMKVLHISDIDYNTNYYTFKDALQALKVWSSDHPTHLPLYVMVELKEDGISDHVKIAGFKTALKFDLKAMLEVRDEINFIFADNPKQILSPDDFRKNHSSLREAITTIGYPKLQEARGKIVFILMAGERLSDELTKQYPSYKGLPFFTFAEPNKPEAVFIKVDDPIEHTERIKDLVAKGYMVRTRSDVETIEPRKNDYTMFNKAKESNAQIISTDFYKPFPKTGFVLKREMLK